MTSWPSDWGCMALGSSAALFSHLRMLSLTTYFMVFLPLLWLAEAQNTIPNPRPWPSGYISNFYGSNGCLIDGPYDSISFDSADNLYATCSYSGSGAGLAIKVRNYRNSMASLGWPEYRSPGPGPGSSIDPSGRYMMFTDSDSKVCVFNITNVTGAYSSCYPFTSGIPNLTGERFTTASS